MDITYRLATPEDAKGIFQIMHEGLSNGYWIYTSATLESITSLPRIKDRLSDKNATNIYFLAIDESTNVIIGFVQYNLEKGRMRHKVELGWNIRQDFARRGIGTSLVSETLKHLKGIGIKKVEAEVAKVNTASVKIAKGLKFSKEGEKKFSMIGDKGEQIDTLIFGKIL